MKLTIAEAELLRGKEQRTAAALDAIARDMANANVANAQPAPTYTAQAPNLVWYSAFDEYGRIRSCFVTDPKEVQRRTKLHDQMVLPEPSDQRGYVFTLLDAFGRPEKRRLVSVRTYLCRYYLWQHKARVIPWNDVLKRDREMIRRITGKSRLRGAWRCFFFGAGKEIVHAFDFSD
ncbi:hypothetical protein ACXYMP_05760 [Aliiroseovarius sp. CAU 1755]